MIYFILLFAVIILLYFILENRRENGFKPGKFLFVSITCLLIILFQGFRSFNVGIDLKVYLEAFTNIGKNNVIDMSYQNFEFGYVLFNELIYAIGFDKRCLLIIIAVIINVPLFYVIYRYSPNPLLSFLWYAVFGTFIVSFSTLRQAISISIILFSMIFVEKRKLLLFILCILLATTFHSSGLVGILIYPLFNFKKLNYLFKFRTKFIITIMLFIVLFIFKEELFYILSYLYYGDSFQIIKSVSYSKLLVYLMLYIVSYIRFNKNNVYRGIQNLIFVCLCGYLFASLHPYFTRIFYVFETLLSIFVPYIFINMKIKEQKVINCLIYVALLILFFTFIVGGLDTLPFSFM